jgi:uncharacterized Zn finger protein
VHEGGRLGRGRAYARSGQVLEFDLRPGLVTARVQGSRRTPYEVVIEAPVADDAAWAAVEAAMAQRAAHLARLLAGEMPPEIEDVFDSVGVALFPRRARDLRGSCSCPDWGDPCKHVAAVYYLLAEAFDRDPFLVLAWRGRTRERLLAELHAVAGVSDAPAASPEALPVVASSAEGLLGGSFLPDLADPALPADPDAFWRPSTGIAAAAPGPVGPAHPAARPDAVLDELDPSGLLLRGRALEALLAPAYRAASAVALERRHDRASDQTS